MIKLTLKQLNFGLQALAIVGNQPIRNNAKLAYNLSKIIKALRAENDIAREQEAAIFRQFDAKEENGRLWFDADQLTPDQQSDFNKQIGDLHAVEVEIWGNQITVAEIDAAGLSLSPIQFEQLDWLIKEESENESQLNYNG